MVLRIWAEKMGRWLAVESGQPQRAAVLSYGLEYLLGSGLKGFAVLAGALALDVLPEALTAMAAIVGLRLFAGGVHNRTYWRCFAFSMASILGAAWAAVQLPPWFAVDALASILIVGAMTVAMVLWAPVQTGKQSAPGEGRYRVLRWGAVALPLLWWTLIKVGQWPPSIVHASLYGLLIQSFSVTPWGGTSFRLMDNFLDRWKGGEMGC